MHNPHQVTKEFEAALCEYTGSKYAVAVSSCTAAIEIALAYWLAGRAYLDGSPQISLPKRTYVSVPMVARRLGIDMWFRDEEWFGMYQLTPARVFDSARRFTSDMFKKVESPHGGTGHCSFVCVSFHASKILGIEQGGAVLHDSDVADAWLRKARFDGRTEGVTPADDTFDMLGYHCYMNPSTAAQGLLKLHSLPRHNADLPNDHYPDLSQMEIFK